jgi:hypothetical protein
VLSSKNTQLGAWSQYIFPSTTPLYLLQPPILFIESIFIKEINNKKKNKNKKIPTTISSYKILIFGVT